MALVEQAGLNAGHMNDFHLSPHVLDDVPVAVQLVDKDGTILRANHAQLRLIEYPATEYIGRNFSDFCVPNPETIELMAQLRDGKTLRNWPAELRCASGQIRHVVIDSMAVEGPDGVLTRCFLRDVTDQKHAEEALRVSETRFRALVEQAPFSIQLFSPDGRTRLVNRAWSELWGVRLEDIPDYNILEDPQLVEKALMPRIARAFAGEAVTLPAILYDPNETIPGKTRNEDPVRWVAAVAYPIKDDQRKVREVVLMHQDITARKKAEAAVRESEQKLRLLADTIPQLAWMAHPDGYVFWYNRGWHEYTGTTPEDMEGWGWQRVHDPAVLPQVLEKWQGSIARGERFEMVFPLRSAQGEFRPFLTRVNPFRDAEGHLVYWCGTNTDISDIKAMEATLRDTDRRKDEFLATLAHELRNPLAPIRNSLQILRMPQVEPATSQQMLAMMERQVQHLVRLVDDLLDVSRVMRGRIELRREQVELAQVVARAVETAQPLVDTLGHKLEIALPSESLIVEVDPVRLSQVVSNLLTNAAKYTDGGGHILLSATRERQDVVIRVRDNGIGIAPEVLPHIFELFMQAEHAASRAQGGLGIGLTLSKNIALLHGGTIEARSAGLGHGAEFVVRLPVAVDVPASPQAHAPATNIPKSSILVIDDNEDAAETLSTLLRLQGHDVAVAYDGAAGLELARANPPELVFIDLGMPRMDGYEVARRMRQTSGLTDAMLIALTGWGQEADRAQTADAGFDHHIVKPAEPAALERVIGELGQRGRAPARRSNPAD